MIGYYGNFSIIKLIIGSTLMLTKCRCKMKATLLIASFESMVNVIVVTLGYKLPCQSFLFYALHIPRLIQSRTREKCGVNNFMSTKFIFKKIFRVDKTTRLLPTLSQNGRPQNYSMHRSYIRPIVQAICIYFNCQYIYIIN